MLPHFCLSSALVLTGHLGIETTRPAVRPTTPSAATDSHRVVQNSAALKGTFQRLVRPGPQGFTQQFVMRTAVGADLELEVSPSSIVTRNGQPARIGDLKPGDRLDVLLTPMTKMAARVEASGTI
jgi:hypothetical protein